jgi:hypothetical protein
MSRRWFAGGLAIVLALSLPGAGEAKGHTPHAKVPASEAPSSGDGSDYYTNVNGHRVHRPIHADRAPAGWTARCGDGSYSFSENRRGTCSHHGGVSQWR